MFVVFLMSGMGVGCESSAPVVHVFVASSMGAAVTEVARGWSEGSVVVHVDASSRIVRQVDQGAPADIVVTADESWMAELRRGRSVADEVILARNRLVVVAGRPLTDWGEVTGFSRVALAGETVPVGRYARQALAGGGVGLEPRQVVEAASARDVVRWVRSGEADAGFVYASDRAGLMAVEVPEDLHDPIVYPAVLLTERPEARAFFESLKGGGETFRTYGFGRGEAAVVPQVGLDFGPIWLGASVSFLALLLSSPLAVAGGWWLSQAHFRGKWLVSTVFLAPLVMPPVVTGYLLLFVFGRNGLLGQYLRHIGLELSFSMAGAILAAAVVGFPLFVLACKNAFEAVDPNYLDLARTLGLSRWQMFRKVAFPLALPGVFAGAVLAFGRGLGEFGATVVFAGNMEGVTRTIPLAVYSALEQPGGESQAWMLAGASIMVSLVCVAGWESMNAWQRRRMEWRHD